MTEERSYEEKVKIFLEEYNKGASGRQAAITAGWALNRAHKTASELLKKPDILRRIKLHDEAEKLQATTGDDSIESIIEGNFNNIVKNLANKAATGDMKAAKEFTDFVFKYKKQQIEELGEYDGCSLAEIIRNIDQAIADSQELKQRLVEAVRTGEVQEGSDALGIPGLGQQGPKEECVGNSPQNDSQ